MEALAKLVADTTEFLVGGVLFLGSVALLAHVFLADQVEALLNRQIPSTAAGALSIVAVALMYAFGVIAEGLSRMLFERRLTWLTVHRWEFVSDTEGVARNVARLHRTEERQETSFHSLGVGDQRKVAIGIREEWRAAATSYNESLGNTIEAQLKRLRIERTFFLSSLVCLLALSIEGNWGMAGATAVVSLMAALLVEERFKRFLGAIVRAHIVMQGGHAKFDSGVPTGASA